MVRYLEEWEARVQQAIADLRARQIPDDVIQMVADTLAPKPIALPVAAKKHGIPDRTIHTWVRRGHVRRYGYQRGPGPKGILIIDEGDVIRLKHHPPRPGRPPSERRKPP